MSETVQLQLISPDSASKLWQQVALLLQDNSTGAKLQDLFDEVLAGAGDTFEEILEQFPDLWVEQAEFEQGKLSVEFLAGPEAEELAEALESFFEPLPIKALTIELGCDDAD
ncbi:hypothetical protein [Agarivorans albus]|uniref:Uncharacterized protein n=1 Tax=Agarivorans albus MKT 106 TaxID=1331007 RepID=R9PR44_AGAAL|nr:hypothetical protein [Agarivorans albus]GAD03842.1 hypothetical protein AALB_3922 [Agarivorans albus MKT 106]